MTMAKTYRTSPNYQYPEYKAFSSRALTQTDPAAAKCTESQELSMTIQSPEPAEPEKADFEDVPTGDAKDESSSELFITTPQSGSTVNTTQYEDTKFMTASAIDEKVCSFQEASYCSSCFNL